MWSRQQASGRVMNACTLDDAPNGETGNAELDLVPACGGSMADCKFTLKTHEEESTAVWMTAARLGDALTLSKLGSKIKGVFKTSTVEGSLAGDITDLSEEADLMEEGHVMVSAVHLWDGPLRDLSAWRVMVPEVLVKAEPENPNRCYYTYLVDVRRVDVIEDDFEPSRWTVERRYNEFYVLEQKLTEFHGEFDDIQLPPKKSFGTKNVEFLDSKKAALEQYLQRLLTIPGLRGSELLYSFFTSGIEFSSSFLPDLNLGKMTNGAIRLVRKEKGQNLDPFLHSFLLSTETCKSKPCKWSDKDSDTISISSEKMANSVYENNANVDLPLNSPQPSDQCDNTPADGAFDTLLYLAEKVYHAPFWLWNVLLSVRIVIKQTLDTYLNCYLAQKLNQLGQERYIVKVIHLLRDALFFDTDLASSDEDKKHRQDCALKGLQDYIPKLFVYCVGREKHLTGTRLVMDLLQQPRLNKQLSYMLLDVIMEELFPELNALSPDTIAADSTRTGHWTLSQSQSLGQQTGPNRLVHSRHSIT
ncbi:Sorting nexin-14 [Lamellibrachia satsuma]|nr:Sorting nexin-14 [Lamellibrachia satsuma]